MIYQLGLIRPRKINNTGIFLYVVNVQRSQPGIVTQICICVFQKIEGRPPHLVLIQGYSPSVCEHILHKVIHICKGQICHKNGHRRSFKKIVFHMLLIKLLISKSPYYILCISVFLGRLYFI